MKVNDFSVQYNNENQAVENYPGLDNVSEITLKKGTLVIRLEAPDQKIGGDYFGLPSDLLTYDCDSKTICQGVQVTPFYHKDITGDNAQYKTHATVYMLTEDTKVAFGNTLSNNQYGIGGLKQIVIPYSYLGISENIASNFKKSSGIVKVDLNNYQENSLIPGELHAEIGRLRTDLGDRVNSEGRVELKNFEISKESYDLIQLRLKMHENKVKELCANYDYNRLLSELNLDRNNIKLKENLLDLKYKMEDYRLREQALLAKFEKQLEVLKSDPELLEGWKREHIDFMLDPNTIITKEMSQQIEYLNEKLNYLENTLDNKAKDELMISDEKSDLSDFTENRNIEAQIKEMYGIYTAKAELVKWERKRLYLPLDIEAMKANKASENEKELQRVESVKEEAQSNKEVEKASDKSKIQTLDEYFKENLANIEKHMSDKVGNRDKIDKILNSMKKKLDSRKNLIQKAEKHLAITEKHQEVAKNFATKKLFKKAYQAAHMNEKYEYDESKNVLSSLGIRNLEQLNTAKENYNLYCNLYKNADLARKIPLEERVKLNSGEMGSERKLRSRESQDKTNGTRGQVHCP